MEPWSAQAVYTPTNTWPAFTPAPTDHGQKAQLADACQAAETVIASGATGDKAKDSFLVEASGSDGELSLRVVRR